MVRSKVDPEQAQKAIEAVRSGAMSLRAAAQAYGVNKRSLSRRLSGDVSMDAKVGPRTVLTVEEENFVEDALLYAARYFIGIDRTALQEHVRQLCNDGRDIPWDAARGPGRSWLDGFFKRHPALSERSARIYEANRIMSDDEIRLQTFYKDFGEFVDKEKIPADHLWNTDETGEVHI
ncbi:unnamed protein product [Ectocarpus sp. 12 AP-2014]